MIRCAFLLMALALMATPAFAQEKKEQGAEATKTAVIGGRNMVFDAAIVILMMGGTLFAVCRSSRRN